MAEREVLAEIAMASVPVLDDEHEPAFAYDSDDWGDEAADDDFDE
jgi:hypothetical protein